MADVKRTVEVLIQGNDQISKTITGVTSGLDSFGGKVQSVTGPLADFSKQLVQIEVALAALAVGGMALAVTAAGNFNASFNEISTLLDVTGPAVDKFKEDILDYATQSTASIEDINSAIYNAISAGTDYEDSIDVVATAEKLAIATKGQLSDTTKLLTQTVNAYGSENLTAGAAADYYFTLIKGGVTKIDELSASIGKATPLAASLNIPIETLTSALAALTKSGLNTSEAVTTLTSLFTAFLKPPAAATAILGKNSDALSAAAIKSKGFEEALKDVIVAVDGDEASLSRLLGRKEALIAALILGKDESGYFKDALESTTGAMGSAALAADKMAENFNLANQNIVNNFTATLIKLGGPIEADYKAFADEIGRVFQAISFSYSEGAFDPIYEALSSFSSDLLAFISSVADNLPEALAGLDFTGFIASIDDLGDTVGDLFSAFFGDIDLTTAEGLRSAIQKIVDVFTTLNLVVDGILETWEPFIRTFGNFVTEALKSEDASKKFIGEILGWAGVIDKVIGSLGFLTAALNVLVSASAITSVLKMTKTIGSLGTAGAGLVTALGITGGAIAAFAAGYVLAEWAYKNVDAFKALIDSINDTALSFSGLDDASIRNVESLANETKEAGDLAVAMVRLLEEFEDVPDSVETEILVKGTDEYESAVSDILAEIKDIPESKFVKIQGEIVWDGELNPSAPKSNDLKAFLFSPDEVDKQVTINVADDGSITLIQNKLDTGIPAEKKVEVQLEGDDLVKVKIATITNAAETIQSRFEWEARVDIAEFETNAEIMVALAQTIEGSFISTGDVITSLFSSLENASGFTKFLIEDQIALENKRRAELLQLEKDLTAAQIDYLKSRTSSAEQGEAAINISMEGIYPELEIIMWEIVRRVQMQANTEGMEFLLGL